jgi:hypothetical protein
MATILFFDMLGARKRWQNGGTEEAMRMFNHFGRLVNAAIREEDPQSILQGGIETDSAMLICDSVITSLRIAQRIYRWAFRNPENPRANRLWLRGCIVPYHETFTRRESPMRPPFDQVKAYTYSDEAFDAISIEKSGFKGMRVLVRSELIDAEARNALRIPFGQASFITLKRLRHSNYPNIIQGELLDFLWMACAENDEWEEIAEHMASRLRYSAHDIEEFSQAAATQVLFHECGAIRQSAISRSIRLARVAN